MQNFNSQPANMSIADSQHAASFMSISVLSLEHPIKHCLPSKEPLLFYNVMKVYVEVFIILSWQIFFLIFMLKSSNTEINYYSTSPFPGIESIHHLFQLSY